MVTGSSSASKKTAGTSSKTAHKTAAGAAPAATPFSAALPSFEDVTQMFKGFSVPGVNIEAILEGRRKDIAALVEANKAAYEGMQTLARRQAQMAEEAMREWQAAAAALRVGRGETLGANSDIAQKALGKAIGNMRELAELATASQTRVFELMQKRSQENIEEMRRLFQQK